MTSKFKTPMCTRNPSQIESDYNYGSILPDLKDRYVSCSNVGSEPITLQCG